MDQARRIGVNARIWMKREKGEGDMELFDGGTSEGVKEEEKVEGRGRRQKKKPVWVTLLLETRPIK